MLTTAGRQPRDIRLFSLIFFSKKVLIGHRLDLRYDFQMFTYVLHSLHIVH